MAPKDDQVIRILIHTDSHLGFRERDPVRGNDSFASFEESLKEGKKRHVDMVLHAGDMFHENKPSRRTMHSALKIFREQCLGEDPVYISCVNKQDEVFKSNQGVINYEDPYHSVSLPYFAIHGNHDDPSRDGSAGDALAALDVLAMSNVLNYYGKSDRADDVEIHPVLIEKNGTKLALYGLGAIRDERLNRMWRQKKVKFVRPRDIDGEERWFNILVLHQNRDYGRGTKNCIHESMIPDWVNVVVWGNEHECKPELAPTSVGCFRIYQPGSSIATSLVRTESGEYPKKYGILEVNKGMRFRLNCFNFTQLRPFIYDEVRLQDLPELNPQDPKIEENIKAVLQKKVQEMIHAGRESAKEVQHSAKALNLTHRIKDAHLILARLRVDYEGFVSLNQQRFGALFVDQVANPAELLLFSKTKKYTNPSGGAGASAARKARSEQAEAAAAEGVTTANLEEMVTSILSENSKMGLLPHNEMELALDSFIHKKNANAISDTVHKVLEDTQGGMYRDQDIQGASSKDAIYNAAKLAKNRVESRAAGGSKAPAAKKAKTQPTAKIAPDNSDDDSVDKAPTKGRPASKLATTSTKRSVASKRKRSPSPDSLLDTSEEEKEQQQQQQEEEEEEDDVEEPPAPAPKRGRGRASAKAPTATKAKTRPVRASAKKKSHADSDAEDEEVSEDIEDIEDSDLEYAASPQKRGKRTAAPTSIRVSSRRAPVKKKATVTDLVSDDEEETQTEAWPTKPAISQVKLSDNYSPAVSGRATRTRRTGLPASLTQGSQSSTRSAALDQDWD